MHPKTAIKTDKLTNLFLSNRNIYFPDNIAIKKLILDCALKIKPVVYNDNPLISIVYYGKNGATINYIQFRININIKMHIINLSIFNNNS